MTGQDATAIVLSQQVEAGPDNHRPARAPSHVGSPGCGENLPGNEGHGIDWDARLNAMLGSGRPGDASEAFFQMVGMQEEMINNMKRGPAWASFEAVAPTLAYDSAAMGDRDGGLVPVDLFPRVQVPTLVLVGGADHEFMVDVARLLVDGLPDPHFHHLLGAGHDAGPDVVALPVKRFLLD